MVFNNIEDLRKKLLKQIIEEDPNIYGDEFKRDFYNILENCIISLMEKEDSFFGMFMVQVKREISYKISWPIMTEAALTGYVMYFNPLSLLKCSYEEIKALIKHDIYHIMFGHIYRARALYDRYSKLAVNLSMDISVNQYIKHLPSWSAKLDNVKFSYNIDLKEEQSMEKYAELIQRALDAIKRKGQANPSLDTLEIAQDLEKAHDKWNNIESMGAESLKEMTKKLAFNANKGKIPTGLEDVIASFFQKPDLPWQDYLKRMLRTLPQGHKKTITRKDRRQPYRLDLRGTLKNRIAEIIVAVDISGSITDKEIEQIIIEIFSIIKNHEAEITIIECDNKIRRVYKINSKRDIKKRLDKRGGTAFSPVFEYIKEKSWRNHILIYFTDGLGEQELKVKPIHFKTLWVLTGKGEKLSLKEPYGEVKRLKAISGEEVDNTYGLKVMREMLHDWAR